MAFKMSESSLFAILLRSPWWYSILIGCLFIAISLAFVGGQYVVFGVCGAIPFFVIAGISVHKQSKRPSKKRVQEVVDQARSMSAIQVGNKIAESYTAARYDSEPFKGNAADLELIRGNRKLLLSSKRFKAGSTGIEPLKQLVGAGENAEATGYLYVALGDVSDAALNFANQNDIELVQATRLAAYFDGQADIE